MQLAQTEGRMEDDDLIDGKGGWLGWVVAALLWAAVGIALHIVLGRA